MLISVGEEITGYKITEQKEVVFGVANSTEGGMYRQSSLKKLMHAAELVGANAITNVHVEIYQVSPDVTEATAYGNAVVAEQTWGRISQQPEKPTSFLLEPQVEDSPIAEIVDTNGYKFVVCPKCKSKYKADVDENNHIKIVGFNDVDDDEPGLQIYKQFFNNQIKIEKNGRKN
mgnify:CR=1 FL=1